MRRAPAWIAAIGVLVALAWPSAAPAASVWVTLAAGIPGSDTPTSSSDFTFDNPHAPLIAINQLTGGVSAEATTAGGSSFFGGVGTPVLLNLSDGSAYIASGGAPNSAKTAGAGGGTAASAAPVAGGNLPTNAALLGVNLAESANGSRALTATVTDSTGHTLGTGSLTVPDGGWFVLGLTQNPDTTPPPVVTPPPPPTDTGPTPPPTGPVDTPPPTSPPTSGPVATPEPASLVLAAIGGVAIRVWRRYRPSAAPI